MLLQAFYPSSIAQEKWKEVALDDKNVHLDDKDIEKLVHQQKLEDFQRFLPVWKAVVAGTGEAFTEAGVNTFDQFVDVFQLFYAIRELPANDARPDMCHSCTCPAHSRYHGRCKHSIHEGVRKGKFTKPQKFANLERGKRPAGRPKKTKSALQKQPTDLQQDDATCNKTL